jgi:hypothetical protein
MSAAAAEISGKRLVDFGSGRVWVPVKDNLCGHDHSVNAISALRCLLGNERLLKWMWLIDGAEPFQRDHRRVADRRQREYTGAGSLGANNGGARAALRKAASKLRSIEAEIIAQDVEKRRVPLSRDGMFSAVYVDAERFRHRILLRMIVVTPSYAATSGLVKDAPSANLPRERETRKQRW